MRVQGENPPRGGGQQPVIGEQPQSQTIIVNADDAVGAAARDLDDAARLPPGRRGERTPPSRRRRSSGKQYNVVTFTGDNKAQVNGYINDQNLVERVETWIDNAYLGDMLFEAVYSDYKDFGGVEVPDEDRAEAGRLSDLRPERHRREGQRRRDHPAAAGARRRARRAAPAAGAAAAAVPTEKLADGVYPDSRRLRRRRRRLQGLHRRHRRAAERSARACRSSTRPSG